MKINVNGKTLDFEEEHITYEQIVALAGAQGHPSVIYHASLGNDVQRAGSMHVGCAPLTITEGMRFSVMPTGNA